MNPLEVLRRGPRRSENADAVVTGAGSGIGAALAAELARRGGTVVCSDIDAAAAERTAAALRDAGGRALGVRCDVTSLDEVAALADTAVDFFDGPPTLVVNNAGIGAGGTLVGQTPMADWHRVIDVNLWGPIHGCHVFVPLLRDAPRHRARGVVNVASAAAFGAAPRMAAYNVSKSATLSLSETLAAELSGTGIGVTALCPTFVKTDIVSAGVASGAIIGGSTRLADTLMRVTGFSPARVARSCLRALDRGDLYCMPQPDARLGWGVKRLTPSTYTSVAGLTHRVISD